MLRLMVVLAFGCHWRYVDALTPEQKNSFLCADPCDGVMLDQLKQWDKSLSTVVETNQDFGGDVNAGVTDLFIRAPCVDWDAVTTTLAPLRRMKSIAIYADKILTRTTKLVADALPGADSITINALVLEAEHPGKYFPLPRYDLFELMGFPEVLRDGDRPNGYYVNEPNHDWFRGKYNVSIERLEGIRMIQGFTLPRVRRMIQTIYTGPPFAFIWLPCNFRGCRQLTSPENFYALFPKCEDVSDAFQPSLLFSPYGATSPNDVRLQLPIMCIRSFGPVTPSRAKLSLYFLEYDVIGVGEYPYDLVRVIMPTPGQFGPSLAGKLDPSLWYISSATAIEKVSLQYLVLANKFCSDRSNGFNDWTFPWRAYLARELPRLVILFDWVTQDEGGSNRQLPPMPYAPPNLGLSTILLNCWSTAARWAPQSDFFRRSLDDLIEQLRRPGGPDENDVSLADAVKLRTNINVTFPSGQRPVTRISYQLYLDTLVGYAGAYNTIQPQLDNALNFLQASRQRRESALALLETSRNSLSTAKVVVFRLQDQLNDVSNAWSTAGNVVVQKNITLAAAVDKINGGLQRRVSQSSLMLVLSILKGIANIGEGIAKGNIEGAWKGVAGFIDAGKAVTDLASLVSTFIKLGDRLGQLQRINTLFADLVLTRQDAQLMFQKVIAAVTSDKDGALFTDADREKLGTGLFTYDLSTASRAVLDYENLRDNAADIMQPFLQQGIGGATDFTTALREFANAGVYRLKLDLERNQALSDVIVAGVQYLNTLRSLESARKALLSAESDPLRIRDMTVRLVLQRLSLKYNLLTLMNDACDAYVYANLERCPIPDSVLNGRDDAQLVKSATTLYVDFAKLPSLPQTVRVRVTYQIASDGTIPQELAGLRQNGTLSFQVNPSSRQFLAYYGVGIDLLAVEFDGIILNPPVTPDGDAAQVRVTITSDGFSFNVDKAREVLSFRGPATLRSTVFAPATREVFTPGDVYPGDVYKYYKPSPFNNWQLRVNDVQPNDPDGSIDTSNITRAVVTFQGRGFVFPDLLDCSSFDEERAYLPTFDKYNCTQAHICKRSRAKCRALAKKLKDAKAELCHLHEGFCVEVLIG